MTNMDFYMSLRTMQQSIWNHWNAVPLGNNYKRVYIIM
jgi:hypothetical protein